MAHYALLDNNNVVTEVFPGRNEDEVINGISNWEEYYQNKRGQKCIRTSYNASTNGFRKHYAGIGFTYDESLDAFIPKKCHEDAVLDQESCTWTCSNSEHQSIV